ncbi:MAG: hypothetical protein LBD86_05390, partial [Spirochaetaceae bacterium]|nr:hypothetical protein [Spirochaetaceae bacterium]
TFSVKSTTIKNFDDGKDSRPRSIGTVLLAGNESVINFYDGNLVDGIISGGSLSASTEVKDWMMKTAAPALRVVYRWAN